MSRTKTLARTRAQARKRPQPTTPPGTGPFPADNKLNAVLCILLAAVTIALYSPVIGYPFVQWDDAVYVTANPHIRGGLSWNTIKWAFTSTETAAYWHPLTWLSHALDYQLFALNPAGHHLHSVLVHALNAVFLFLLLAWVTKRVGPSLLVAALFALHPLNVESVAWIAERKNVLSTLFFILAIGAYAWYAQKPEWRRYMLVAALFAAGLMVKPMVITLPFVLLLLDYWPLERIPLDGTEGGPAISNSMPRVAFSRLLLEKIPLLFLSAASAWITMMAQRPAEHTFVELPLGIRIENAVVAYGLYLSKMLWPARLAAFYPHSVIALPAWQWILSALLLISVTAFVISFRGKRYLPVGWFWFLGTLIPVIGLVQAGEQAMADRFAYVPLIGIFVMIAFGLADLAKAKKLRTVWRVIPALCALTVLGFATSRQMSYWDSEYDLWLHTLALTEPNALAHEMLAEALMDSKLAMTPNNQETWDTGQKRLDDARWHFEQALKIYRQSAQQNPGAHLPDMAMELNNLGTLDGIQNRMDEARQHLEGALKIYRQLAQQNSNLYLPNLAMTMNDLGNVGRFQNQMDDARQHYEGALKIYRQLAQQNPSAYLPGMAGTLDNLGFLDENQNRIEDSRVHYTEAMTIYRKLAQGNPARYAGDVARVESSLRELDKKVNSPIGQTK